MCGICGLVCADPKDLADAVVVGRMNDAMAHRGPDDAGLWHIGPAALAMRRLSIIDLAHSTQPMANDAGSVVIVFNGEIYNFQEVRQDLEKRGHAFHTAGDTEVILRGYEAFGDAVVDRLNGMFAFAIYDKPRQRLLIARDRLGIKPLFFVEDAAGLVFASELDALAKSGRIPGRIDMDALDAYFTYLYIPAPRTIYEGVRKLCPGERLIYEGGRVRIERYWRPEFCTNEAWTLDSAAERYRELLEDAVRLQRISDVPLGAFLSGGIDSTSVVGTLASMSDRPVKTFTIGFDDAHSDELAFARIAAKRFATDHTEEMLRPDMVSVASELARFFGEPFADSSAVPTWLVSRLARRDVTVALSGDGGDELFGGYTWMHRTLDVLRARKAPASLRRLAGAALSALPASPGVAKWQRLMGDTFLDPREAFRRRLTCFDGPSRARLFTAEAAGRRTRGGFDPFVVHGAGEPGKFEQWMLYMDTVMYLPDDILAKVDRMSMANSLEARVPLLDHRIVEFAATLPFELKFHGGVSKRVAKHALRDLIPPELLAQRKQGFAIPIQRWFREDLASHFRDIVLGGDARCRAWIDAKAASDVMDAHVQRRENYGHHLWALLMFEHWLRYAETAGVMPS